MPYPHDVPAPASSPAREAGEVVAESGVVLLDGPGAVALALTPQAADETGRRLCEAARRARRQLQLTELLLTK